jgi:folate-dependent phosphoribosylglycinamide formyltransferase PurN
VSPDSGSHHSGSHHSGSHNSGSQRLVLLAGPGDSTNIVYHYLWARFDEVVAVVEEPVDRLRLAKRRAKRVGWPTVAGQIAFVAGVMPLLRRRGQGRISEILAEAGFDNSAIAGARSVDSVNSPEAIRLLQDLEPSVVVVNGTRIISDAVLRSVGCSFVNTHAGITPRYRGVHGGYWALREGEKDLVGTTIHLVDPGIDTGGILAQGVFEAGSRDTIATYPYLHLECGLPLLEGCVREILDGRTPVTIPSRDKSGASVLRWHPTIWGYVRGRVLNSVR